MTTVRSSVFHPARISSSVGPSLPYRVSMRTRQPVSLQERGKGCRRCVEEGSRCDTY